MRLGRFGVALVAASVVAVAASVLGCGSQCLAESGDCRGRSTASQTGATAREDVVCTSEAMTGTHIVETHCYRRSQVDERRAADRAAVERMLIKANRPLKSPPNSP